MVNASSARASAIPAGISIPDDPDDPAIDLSLVLPEERFERVLVALDEPREEPAVEIVRHRWYLSYSVEGWKGSLMVRNLSAPPPDDPDLPGGPHATVLHRQVASERTEDRLQSLLDDLIREVGMRADVLRSKNYIFRMLAVWIDGTLVPRKGYASTTVPDGAEVQVLHMIAGG